MKPIATVLLTACLFAGTLFGVEIDGPERVDEHRLVQVSAGGGEGYAWIVRRTDGHRPDSRPIDGGRVLVWTGPPGSYDVDVIVIRDGTLEQGFRRIVVGPAPPPDPPDPPDPDPDEPDEPDDREPDEFDDIGRRVAAWAAGLTGAPMVAERYEAAAGRLRNDPRVTIDDVGKTLSDELRNAVSIDEWGSVFVKLNDDLRGRWPMSRGTLADYYSAVAQGLR